MRVKIFIIISLLLLFWFAGPVRADSFLGSATEGSKLAGESIQKGKTYLLTLLPGGGRLTLKINPPATKIIVTSQSGDTAVRCGGSPS